jgi:DNA repair ATPase RecN
MQVEEGFLNGLDLHFSTGLNVLIGARGTGKTSIVELMRFCLGAQANTADSARRAADHARSILGSGQVTLTAESIGATSTITRAADDPEPRSDGPIPRPIIFAQSEIEQVGLLPSGRLRIVDGFIPDRSRVQAQETKLSVDARSATAELAAGQRELADLEERLADLTPVNAALTELVTEEAALVGTSALAGTKKVQLDALSVQLSAEGVKGEFFDRVVETLNYWINPLDELHMLSPSIEAWKGDGDDPLADVRARYLEAERKVTTAADEFRVISQVVDERRQAAVARRVPLETEARNIRREIDEVQEGAGQLTRRISQLRERKAQLEALQAVAQDRRARVTALQQRRGLILDQLEALRDDRFDERQAIAAKLNQQLKPRIRITVTRAGDLSAYSRVLAEALRGSGLKYAELATQIPQQMSPREFLEAVELNQFEEVATLCGIARDRAARLVVHMRENGLEELAVCHLEDEVDFYLLDGGDYKDLGALSTGQRCTIILPILLEHRDMLLVIDQPEDHIDNAFIADTVIKALEARSADGQILVSTHNANIPVLGNADLVIQMGSDGRQGYIKHRGELEAAETIEAITGLMEGGRDAFARRAAVYARY